MRRVKAAPKHRHARVRMRARRALARPGSWLHKRPVLDWRALLVHGHFGPHRLADLQVEQALDWLGPPSHWTDNPFWPTWPAGTRAPKGWRVDWPVILAWGGLELYVMAPGALWMLHLDSFGPRGRPSLGGLTAVHAGLVKGGMPLAAIRQRMRRAGVPCSEARDSLDRPLLRTPAGFTLSFDLDEGKRAPGLGAVTWTSDGDWAGSSEPLA